MRRPVVIAKRMSLSEANKEIPITSQNLHVRRIRARVVWIEFSDPNNPPVGPLESILRVNDYIEILITPEDISEGVPSLNWEIIELPHEAEGIKVKWEVPWGPEITNARLEIQVEGYARE